MSGLRALLPRGQFASALLHAGVIVLAAFVVLVLQGAGVISVFASTLAADCAMYALALMGLSVLYGWTGQLSLGHAAFMGIGAYTAALIGPHTGSLPTPFLVDLIVVVVVGALAGLIVGLPSIRISGIQLVVVTLGFAEVFQWALNNFDGISGGTQGLLMDHTTILGLDLSVSQQRLLATALVAAAGGVVVTLFARTTVARSMTAVRESEQAAASIGINPGTPKLIAFVVSAVFAAVSGLLFAYGNLIVIPGTFALFDNVFLLVAIIVGGRHTMLGVWLGAAFLVVVPEASREVANGALYPVVAGVILIVVMIFAPRGLASLWRRGERSTS